MAKKIFLFDLIAGDIEDLELYENTKYSRYKESYIELRKKIELVYGKKRRINFVLFFWNI